MKMMLYNKSMNNIPPFNSQMSLLLQMISSKDPMATFTKIVESDPSLQPVLNMLKQGMQPQDIFNNLCQQKGIDPNTFLSQIKPQ